MVSILVGVAAAIDRIQKDTSYTVDVIDKLVVQSNSRRRNESHSFGYLPEEMQEDSGIPAWIYRLRSKGVSIR